MTGIQEVAMMMDQKQIDKQSAQAWKGIMKQQLYGIHRMRHRARLMRASATVVAALCRGAELTRLATTPDPAERPGDSP